MKQFLKTCKHSLKKQIKKKYVCMYIHTYVLHIVLDYEICTYAH
jgi:hypothetical protein